MKKIPITKTANHKKIESLTIKLPKDWAEHLLLLEKTTTKTKDYYIQEALYRYLEDLEDLQIGLERLKSKSKTYTPEEANERLKELRRRQKQKVISKNV